MDFQKLVKFRRSSRWLFTNKQIPDNELRKILEAARYAPTPHNSQPFEIIVVKDRDIIKELSMVGFRLTKKYLDEHFYWVRYSKEELESKKDGVFIDVLPKFVNDLKDNPKLINDDDFWKKSMELYSILVQNSAVLLFIIYNRNKPGVGPLKHLWGILSIGAIMQNVWLAANDVGISVQLISGQLMNPDSVKKIMKILRIPENKGYRLMLIFRLGYESKFGKYGTSFRRELSDFVHLDRFTNKYY
ncbi:MAG: nitroreductase family protein [Candidatus Hodarchaeota archaeon]